MSNVSVIIPAFNAADVVASALGAIAAQTVPVHEVIVVDDGSTDGTADIARRWERLLPLQVHRLEQNMGAGLGAGGARAIGIERSSGELIALLDVDDYWMPDHLEVMQREHDRHGGLITANYYLWIPGVEIGRTPSSELVPVPPPESQRLSILSENFVFVSALFSRELYDRAGPMRNIRCEDWDLWINMIDAGAVVTIPDEVTALYRQSPTSVSGTDKLLVGDIDLLEEHLAGRGAEETEVIERALQRRRAKRAFLDGVALADAGDYRRARASWWQAIRTDPSLRRNHSRLNGRVAIRAAACLAAPRTMVRLRQRRQEDPVFVVGARRSATSSMRGAR